ncbi:MAG TPA: DegT/DnrJ/EryC1/StrS aminotransferase family protein [Candidatus Binatia bacterium]|nr:DegT/DnrJ/EryC1/StrS aminotransferase family protein [Candidatus Binatia bacterium]
MSIRDDPDRRARELESSDEWEIAVRERAPGAGAHAPARAERHEEIPFHRPAIGDAEIAEVVATLRSGWLTTGPRAVRFEAAFAERLGVPHALAVSTGTAALHLALRAAGVGPGDEVIVPTFTFVATAEAVLYLGARPVLADVDPATGLLLPQEVERRWTARTRAVVPVHLAGAPCDSGTIGAIAHAGGGVVVDDAAHALPARRDGRLVGTIADATAFSFYATKTLTTGEGGMVTTAREDWAETIRVLRLHGMSRDAWKRYSAAGTWAYDVLDVGYKYNLPDVLAALGLVQLARLDELHEARLARVERYRAGLADSDLVELPEEPPGVQSAWHLYVVRLRLDRLRVDRAAVADALRARGIGTSVHFIPLHLHAYYRRTFGTARGDHPGAEALFARCLSLPLYPDLALDDVDRVVDALRGVLEAARR